LTRRLLDNSLHLTKAGYNLAKPYTPARVQDIVEKTSEKALAVVEPYVERSQQLVDTLDSRLDSMVLSPALNVSSEASQRAHTIISNTEAAANMVRHHMGFVGTSIAESYKQTPLPEPKVEGDDSPEGHQATFLQSAQEKINVNFVAPIQGYVTSRYTAVKRLRANGQQFENDLKVRTKEQLDQLTRVDLISYAAELIDGTCENAFAVAVTNPLAIKDAVVERVSEKAQPALTKVSEVTAKVNEVKAKVTDEVASKYRRTLELATLKQQEAIAQYQRTLAIACEKREKITNLTSASKKYISNMTRLAYASGARGVVAELRKDGFLPSDREVTIAKALELAATSSAAVRAKSTEYAVALLELTKFDSKLAQTKISELYMMLVAANDANFLKGAQYMTSARAFAELHAASLVELAQSSPQLAQIKLQELYSWFLTLSPEAMRQVRQLITQSNRFQARAMEHVVAMPALNRFNIAPALQNFRNTMNMATSEERWTIIVAKAEEMRLAFELALKVQENWEFVLKKTNEATTSATSVSEKVLVKANELKGLANEQWAVVKTQAQTVDAAALVQDISTKMAEMSVQTQVKVLAIWSQIIETLMAKFRHECPTCSPTKVNIPVVTANTPVKDPIEESYQKYCAANNISVEEEEEEEEEVQEQETEEVQEQETEVEETVTVKLAKQTFRDADKNACGTLSKNEIKKYFKNKPEMKRELMGETTAWDVIFKKMFAFDIHGSNTIDEREFVSFFVSHREGLTAVDFTS